jgi:hypothetical protein
VNENGVSVAILAYRLSDLCHSSVAWNFLFFLLTALYYALRNLSAGMAAGCEPSPSARCGRTVRRVKGAVMTCDITGYERNLESKKHCLCQYTAVQRSVITGFSRSNGRDGRARCAAHPNAMDHAITSVPNEIPNLQFGNKNIISLFVKKCQLPCIQCK